MLSPYLLLERDEYSFEFFTDHGLRYVIYFVDYSAQFADYPVLIGRVFMFNIEVVDGDPTTSPGDERIALTVQSVFRAFFLRETNVIVYVCDSLDNRHLARRRKFESWFSRYNDGTLMKVDNVAVIDGTEIHNSIILHMRNESREHILLAYEDLNRSVEK